MNLLIDNKHYVKLPKWHFITLLIYTVHSAEKKS